MYKCEAAHTALSPKEATPSAIPPSPGPIDAYCTSQSRVCKKIKYLRLPLIKSPPRKPTPDLVNPKARRLRRRGPIDPRIPPISHSTPLLWCLGALVSWCPFNSPDELNGPLPHPRTRHVPFDAPPENPRIQPSPSARISL